MFETALKSVIPIELAKSGQRVRIVAKAQKSTKQKSRTTPHNIATTTKDSNRFLLLNKDKGLHTNTSKQNLALFTKERIHSLPLNLLIKELVVVAAPFTRGTLLVAESKEATSIPSAIKNGFAI